MITRVVLVGTLLALSATAHAASSGWVRGQLWHYNRLQGFCPPNRSCVGAHYTKASHNAYLTVPGARVTVEDAAGNVYGYGESDGNGVYLISWWSPSNSQMGRIVWETRNSRIIVTDGAGFQPWYHGALDLLQTGTTQSNPQQWGLAYWGAPSAPDPHTNVYQAAQWTWLRSFSGSPQLRRRSKTDVSIRAARRNYVVPVAMERGGVDVEVLELGVRDLDACRVGALIQLGLDDETSFGRCVCDEVDDDVVSKERATAPVLVMWQNMRCSILFHLLVPGGKWHTVNAHHRSGPQNL